MRPIYATWFKAAGNWYPNSDANSLMGTTTIARQRDGWSLWGYDDQEAKLWIIGEPPLSRRARRRLKRK